MKQVQRIPQWVIDEIQRRMNTRSSGGLTIMFSDGGIRNIHKETEVIHPPQRSKPDKAG